MSVPPGVSSDQPAQPISKSPYAWSRGDHGEQSCVIGWQKRYVWPPHSCVVHGPIVSWQSESVAHASKVIESRMHDSTHCEDHPDVSLFLGRMQQTGRAAGQSAG